ncbi:MAG: helicase-related protein [Nostoc sp.]|uniref:helicase-related protein n=1 Tax=Nostoc sp. TaxID=1180 RepID=UPI002FF57733
MVGTRTSEGTLAYCSVLGFRLNAEIQRTLRCWSNVLSSDRLTSTNYLNIGRTSSQDTGVTPNADVIVATASLEVGFNNPEVGGVIQHKAPRDMASFLQRKGRAGRRRTMRPWTVVVLSD